MATSESGQFRSPPPLEVNSGNVSKNYERDSHQLGDLGEAILRITMLSRPQNNNAQPKVLPCRKIPFAIEGSVNEELDRVVEKGVLVPVTEPTMWVSQMTVVHKPSGKLRICIYRQPLNAGLKLEHYKLPVFHDVLPKLKDVKVFSKLDV